MNTPGKTIINAKKSRDHTELFFKILKIANKNIQKKKFDKLK